MILVATVLSSLMSMALLVISAFVRISLKWFLMVFAWCLVLNCILFLIIRLYHSEGIWPLSPGIAFVFVVPLISHLGCVAAGLVAAAIQRCVSLRKDYATGLALVFVARECANRER